MRLTILLIVLTPLLAACQTAPHNSNPAEAREVAASTQDTTRKVIRTEEEWKKLLTKEQYHVLREKGTDRPFTGKYTYTNDKGTYSCAACGYELFTSDMKFKSDCGWPSFDKELAGDRIIQKEDRSYGMIRTEILCARCGSHLGHLFDDGPTLTGKRYCVNSTSLNFTQDQN